MQELRGYVTPFEVATLLKKDVDNEEVMATIALALSFAEQDIEQYCQTWFTQEDNVAKLYNGRGINCLSLGFFLRNLTKVEVLDLRGQATTLEYVSLQPRPSKRRDGANISVYSWLELKNGDLSEKRIFPEGLENIRVTGDWGLTVLPAAIKRAIILSVQHALEVNNASTVTELEVGFGRTRTQRRAEDLPYIHPVAERLLSQWKYRGFGE